MAKRRSRIPPEQFDLHGYEANDLHQFAGLVYSAVGRSGVGSSEYADAVASCAASYTFTTGVIRTRILTSGMTVSSLPSRRQGRIGTSRYQPGMRFESLAATVRCGQPGLVLHCRP
jgi:hypothetical protein